MPLLRNILISANHNKALPVSRYDCKHSHVIKPDSIKKPQISPVRYAKILKRVMVKPGFTRLDVKIPDQQPIKIIRKKELVKPAQAVWKKGRGSVEKIDRKTGQIYHLEHTPAVYKTHKIEVISVTDIKNSQDGFMYQQPIYTREKHEPPQYKLIRSKMPIKLNQPAPSQTIPQQTLIPNNLKVQKQNAYTPVFHQGIIRTLQQRLTDSNCYSKQIDGIFGTHTKKALMNFQRKHQLPEGKLDSTTLEVLKV